jgi:hypothetical protein
MSSTTINMVNQPSQYQQTMNTSSSNTTNVNTTNQSTNPFINAPGSDLSSKPPDSKQSPIDISKSNVYANCEQKCFYGFDYSNTLLIAKNLRSELLFTCENSQAPPVTYNNLNYNVASFSLFAPSLHQWNGAKVDGEIIIEHIPVYGGKNLYTCIPLMKTNSTSNSTNSNLINQIITETSKNAPGNGDTFNLTINNFNLQNIVPLAPFYNYYGKSKSYNGDFIVFDKTNSISLSSKTFSLLKSLIKPSSIVMFGGFLYYNPKGPNQGNNSDIYISCQPTGSSNEPVQDQDQNNSSSSSVNPQNNDLLDLLNNEWFMIFIVAFFFIVVILLLNYLFNAVGGRKSPLQPPP